MKKFTLALLLIFTFMLGYGSFIHLMDPDGNKIELREPNYVEYDKLGN